jgi:predicted nucleic acid-binding protein
MAQLIDSSLWMGLLRRGASGSLKEMVSPWIMDATSVLAEPVVFELLRFASDAELEGFNRSSKGMAVLETPADVWQQGWELGRACKRKGYLVEGIDLVIAAVALAHDAEIVTFDGDFEKIARASRLKVHLLKAPEA